MAINFHNVSPVNALPIKTIISWCS